MIHLLSFLKINQYGQTGVVQRKTGPSTPLTIRKPDNIKKKKAYQLSRLTLKFNLGQVWNAKEPS